MQDYLIDQERPKFGFKAILLTVALHACIAIAMYLSGSKSPESAPPTTATTSLTETQTSHLPAAKQAKQSKVVSKLP
jgi:hypothetical protein